MDCLVSHVDNILNVNNIWINKRFSNHGENLFKNKIYCNKHFLNFTKKIDKAYR